jgi:hypothetical protein
MRGAIVKFSHNTRTNPIAPLNIMTAAIYMDWSESLRDRQAKHLHRPQRPQNWLYLRSQEQIRTSLHCRE